MSNKAWLNPRKKVLVKGGLRITKDGIQDIDPHEHEYPHANKLKPAKKKDKKEELEGAAKKPGEKDEEGKSKKPGEKDKLTKKKGGEALDKAKKELACRMGA